MFRVSNFMIGLLNTITLILSVAITLVSVYFRVHGHSECQKLLYLPLLALGVFLFLVSLAGFIGSCCRVSVFLWIYLFVMFVLIVGLFVFTLFAFVVTNKGVGQVISGRGYKEYRLGDYSDWLQKHVTDGQHWNTIKSCLIDTQFCMKLGGIDQSVDEFYTKRLSPVQSGCCKPPTYCGFTFKNATFWEIPKSGPAAQDSDCTTWSNHQDTLCYDCKSCKAGMLANLKKDWRRVSIVNISILIFLIIIYSIGCCAFRNNRVDSYKRYRGDR
ncbi:hypothetical protein GIB67_038525 [Kingdonia uniflora]|uniref:Tetraspanin-8 n=1 Tax=Kingdonia uniflora TaxID=39325 RepID=A0A7J7NQ27_9MAGN|nr:hypothetical protein GIB67_038525 [Kingdonia uniflora]